MRLKGKKKVKDLLIIITSKHKIKTCTAMEGIMPTIGRFIQILLNNKTLLSHKETIKTPSALIRLHLMD